MTMRVSIDGKDKETRDRYRTVARSMCVDDDDVCVDENAAVWLVVIDNDSQYAWVQAWIRVE